MSKPHFLVCAVSMLTTNWKALSFFSNRRPSFFVMEDGCYSHVGGVPLVITCHHRATSQELTAVNPWSGDDIRRIEQERRNRPVDDESGSHALLATVTAPLLGSNSVERQIDKKVQRYADSVKNMESPSGYDEAIVDATGRILGIRNHPHNALSGNPRARRVLRCIAFSLCRLAH